MSPFFWYPPPSVKSWRGRIFLVPKNRTPIEVLHFLGRFIFEGGFSLFLGSPLPSGALSDTATTLAQWVGPLLTALGKNQTAALLNQLNAQAEEGYGQASPAGRWVGGIVVHPHQQCIHNKYITLLKSKIWRWGV